MVVGRPLDFADQALHYLWWDQVSSGEVALVVSVGDLNGRSRPKQLQQLHELEDFEQAFEFEHPSLWVGGEVDHLDAAALTVRLDGRMADLVNSVFAQTSHLCDEGQIVLQHMDCLLDRAPIHVLSPPEYAKLKASEALSRESMLDE